MFRLLKRADGELGCGQDLNQKAVGAMTWEDQHVVFADKPNAAGCCKAPLKNGGGINTHPGAASGNCLLDELA